MAIGHQQAGAATHPPPPPSSALPLSGPSHAASCWGAQLLTRIKHEAMASGWHRVYLMTTGSVNVWMSKLVQLPRLRACWETNGSCGSSIPRSTRASSSLAGTRPLSAASAKVYTCDGVRAAQQQNSSMAGAYHEGREDTASKGPWLQHTVVASNYPRRTHADDEASCLYTCALSPTVFGMGPPISRSPHQAPRSPARPTLARKNVPEN